MRRIIPITVLTASFLVLGCNSIKGNQEGDNIAITHKGSAASSATPEQLTYTTFLKGVWNFEEHPKGWIYKGDEPSVIDFSAVWCDPCKLLAPIMDEMAKKYDGKVKFYKVDVGKESKLASVFRIKSIPAVLFIPKHGKPRMQIGLLPHDTYVRIIDEQLLHKKPETRKQ